MQTTRRRARTRTPMRRCARPFIMAGLLMAVSSCASGPASPSPSPAPADDEQSGPSPAQCPTNKLAFTKDDGCRNDGSVEFCLPADDDALLQRVRAIAPTIEANPSSGRAGCDVPAETLYFFPTGEAECTERHGALRDAAWDQLCRIAALPEVTRIVPTWYE